MKFPFIVASATALALATPAFSQVTDTAYNGNNNNDPGQVKGTTPAGTYNLPTFETPVNNSVQGTNCSSCGDDLTAIFTPAQTGYYTFAMASDDGGRVLLSTDATPANEAQIINQSNAWTGSRQYNSESGSGTAAGNFSVPELLTAGTPYYIEGIHAQGGGGQNFAVAAAYSATNTQVFVADQTAPLGDPSQSYLGTITSTAVPEPTTLIGGAVMLLGAFVRRRRSA